MNTIIRLEYAYQVALEYSFNNNDRMKRQNKK